MNDLDILEQCLLTCDAPESVWRPILDDLAKTDATTAVSALYLVARIREALGDNGRRMQDELIEYCRELIVSRKALVTAWDAMCERRGYAESWEWKYGDTWDKEDAEISRAISGASR